jgi:hypothetical protein
MIQYLMTFLYFMTHKNGVNILIKKYTAIFPKKKHTEERYLSLAQIL